MKTAILLNEDLLEMRLGVNTTLAFILGSADLNHETYLVDVRKDKKTLLLTKENSQNLIDEYKKQNSELVETNFVNQKFVKDAEFKSQEVDFDLNDCDLLIQRLDPTREPFPPHGSEDYHEFLTKFLANKKIKNKNFNYPIDCYLDKEFPVAINLDLEVKTWMSFIGDENLPKKILAAKDFSSNSKIVLKPNNSGQSMGVFAVEFDDEAGKTLSDLEKIGIEKLKELQIYHVKNDLENDEMLKIIELLLDCQAAKFNSKSSQLYNSKIVIQPFIEGVLRGDIRVNVAKKKDRFEVLGYVLRKTIGEIESEKFTTCVTGNMALPVSIYGELTKDEIDDLIAKTNKVVDLLNTDLLQKYTRSFELGFDFTLKGDDKTVLLNEVNHLCTALIPVAEAINDDANYDGGLGLVKDLIECWI